MVNSPDKMINDGKKRGQAHNYLEELRKPNALNVLKMGKVNFIASAFLSVRPVAPVWISNTAEIAGCEHITDLSINTVRPLHWRMLKQRRRRK